MNRSILIVICDFLLVCLLVFSSPDVNRVTEHSTAPALSADLTTNDTDSGRDISAALKTALDEDQKGRDQLQKELAEARQNSTSTQSTLAQREKQVADYQAQLQARDQQAQLYQNRQAALQQQFDSAQTNIQSLSVQLQSASEDSVLSRERLAALEDQLRRQADQSAAMQKNLNELALTNAAERTARQQLVGQLQVAEAEKRSAAAQAAQAQEEVKAERLEKEKLAENVKTLATQSGALAQEVRENRELAPNTIFSDLVTNRIGASFTAARPGLFGDSIHHKDTETVLISDGVNTYALCHLQDTPLTFYNPGIDWQSLSGSLSSSQAILSIHSISFDKSDPRVILVPVSEADARQLGSKVYRISADPYKFQNAVLIGAREGYYGECRFEIDLTTPQYVKLDRSFLKGLFGKFNPSSGDLVFSHAGDLLGIMVNGTYCLMLQDLSTSDTFRFGEDVRAEHTGDTLSRLYATVMGMPFKLQ